MATVISAGAVAGLTTVVVLTLLIGATRIIFAMARDDLLCSGALAKAYRDASHAVVISIIVTRSSPSSPGSCLSAYWRRWSTSARCRRSSLRSRWASSCCDDAHLKRGFRAPWSPFLPLLSAAICTYLMLNLTVETWLRFHLARHRGL